MVTPPGADPEQLKNAVGKRFLMVVVVEGGADGAVTVGRCAAVVDVPATAAPWVAGVPEEFELFLLPTATPATITTTTSTSAAQNHHRLASGILSTGGGTRGGGPADPGVRRWRGGRRAERPRAHGPGARGARPLAPSGGGGGGGAGGAVSGGYHMPSLANHHPGP